MTQPEVLEVRVTALESQVRELTERVHHSRHDAAGRQRIVALLNTLVDERGGRPGER